MATRSSLSTHNIYIVRMFRWRSKYLFRNSILFLVPMKWNPPHWARIRKLIKNDFIANPTENLDHDVTSIVIIVIDDIYKNLLKFDSFLMDIAIQISKFSSVEKFGFQVNFLIWKHLIPPSNKILNEQWQFFRLVKYDHCGWI